MSRIFFIAAILCCLIAAARTLPAQIMLDPNASSGIMLGTPNPLLGPSHVESSAANSEDSHMPSWNDPYGAGFLGAEPAGTGQEGTNYGMSNYNMPTFYIRPGMTREQIVTRQAEIEMLKRIEGEEQLRKLRMAIEARQNVQRGLQNLQGLFGESSSYLPQKLTRADVTQSRAPKPKIEPSPERRPGGSAAAVSMPNNPRKLHEPTTLAKLADIQDAEQIQRDREALQKREDARQHWLEQRNEAERGANLFTIAPYLALTPQRLRAGWCHLFDGQTMFGWQTPRSGSYSGGRFFVQDGELRSTPRRPCLLLTSSQFGDATLFFEYQADQNAEAYFLLRTSPDPNDPQSACYMIVLNAGELAFPVGSVLWRQGLHAANSLGESKDTSARKQNAPGSPNWTRIQIQFHGTQLQVTVNQEKPITLHDPTPLGYGYMGLLVQRGDVRFRNMFWRPGPAEALSDPVAPGSFWASNSADLNVKPTIQGTMQLTGGPGFIESRRSYGNFVLQFEYNIAFTSARSSLFFRSVPGRVPSGYEISLQNFPTRADRDQTVGVDAGSFRSLRNGRYVRPPDQAWNHVTLLAVDRRFQTWINGIPVAEMNDVRPPSANPDAGPFLAPGTLRFLAPTAETNIDFRNIRIAPISPRFQTKQNIH